MAWETPKTNWRATDYFNLNDWNRIKNNLVYLADEIQAAGVTRPSVLDLTLTRDTMSLVTVQLANRLETTLKNVKNALHSIVPAKKTWYARTSVSYTQNPNYEDWNRWEATIQQIYTDIQNMKSAWVYSGEINCGGYKL